MPLSSVTAPTAFHWHELPADSQYKTLQYLPAKTLWSLRSTCKAMQQWVDRHVPHLAVHCREGLEMLSSQKRFPSLSSIALVSENDIIYLLPKHIEHLDLQHYRARLDEAALKCVASLPLKSLNLVNCDIDRLSLTPLLQGSSIGTMWMGNGKPISNDNYRALAQHPTLTKLAVHTQSLTDADIDVLSNSPTLIDLTIVDVRTSDLHAREAFAHNNVLQSLYLSFLHLSDSGNVITHMWEASGAAQSPLFRILGECLFLNERTVEALSTNPRISYVETKNCWVTDSARRALSRNTSGIINPHVKKIVIERTMPPRLPYPRDRARFLYVEVHAPTATNL